LDGSIYGGLYEVKFQWERSTGENDRGGKRTFKYKSFAMEGPRVINELNFGTFPEENGQGLEENGKF
jgi:hypothetical protein